MEISEDCQLIIFHYLKQYLCKKEDQLLKEKTLKYKKRTNEGLIA